MNEFTHYGHSEPDPLNCGACALTIPQLIDGRMGINYSGWPLSYMSNGIRIPEKFHKYLVEEFNSDNHVYLENLKTKLKEHGYNIEVIKKNLLKKARGENE